MIIGVGCDIVEHSSARQLEWETDTQVLSRILSSKEFEIYQSGKTIEFLAGRFAAKEAILKSIGTGMLDGISLTEIEILRSKLGKPKIKLNGELKKISERLHVKKWHLSITHSTSYSIAFAIAES
jgi:holo-[acyl-carrier protein] synthase